MSREGKRVSFEYTQRGPSRKLTGRSGHKSMEEENPKKKGTDNPKRDSRGKRSKEFNREFFKRLG